MGLDMYVAIDGSSDPARVREMANAAGFQQLWYEGGPAYSFDEGDRDAVHPILAYWRKANAVHAWIVRELGGGIDECQRIDFPRDRMVDLIERCKRVMLAHAAGGLSQAADEAATQGLLPQSGFFFGSTEIDEYYVGDLRDTVEQLTKILAVKGWGEATFFYQASW